MLEKINYFITNHCTVKSFILYVYHLFFTIFFYIWLLSVLPLMLFLIFGGFTICLQLGFISLSAFLIYCLLLKLSYLLKKHSSSLMNNIEVTPEEKKRIFSYILFLILALLFHCFLIFILTNFPIHF